MNAIRSSGDPNAADVVRLMQRELDTASGPQDQNVRAQITGFYRTLLEQRSADPAALSAFLSSAASRVLNRLQLTLMAIAIPGAAPLAAAGQMVHSLYQRNWSSVAAALPSLAAMLPSLRHWDEVEQLIQLLPADIRSGLEALHGWIESTDEALLPQLDIRQAGPALAVAVLLWQVQKALPPPSQALHGVGRFVAGLPGYWQTLVGMNSVGESLLAHVVTPDGPDLASDKVRPTPQQKKALVAHQKAFDRGHAIVPAWQDTGVAHADWTVPGQPQRGSAIAAPPAAGEAQQHPDAATSPASHPGLAASLIAMVPFLHRAAGFVQVPQAPPPVEMQLMGESALHEVLPTEPLIQPPPMLATAGSAGAMRGFASRYPRTVTAAVATGVAAAAGGVVALARTGLNYFWYSSEAAPSFEAQVDLAALHIEKTPDGAWQSGLSQLEETLDTGPAPEMDEEESALTAAPRAGRARRDASAVERTTTGAPATTRAPPTALAPHEQVHVMRLWALAVANELAKTPDLEWLARAPESEQELLVTYWHALRQEQAALVELDAIPGTALSAALQAQGLSSGWQDIEVDLGKTRIAGVTSDERLPLLEYCLARGNDADSSTRVKEATFLRGGEPISGPELEQLRGFAASAGCTGLRAQVNAQVETLRPRLETAVKAKVVIHALRAKTKGELGSGAGQLRGADIVLGFLQGKPDVESSPLTYVDRLADGTEVSIVVPNYLVLRSTSADRDINGQVVLYRADLSTFQAFDDEDAFREFLDEKRAKAGLFVNNHDVDQTLAGDIVRAAPPHQQPDIRERVGTAWEERLLLSQTRPRDPDAWNPQDAFVLDFTTSPAGLQDWAAGLVRYRQGLEQQRLDQGQLRWSALGIVNSAAEAAYQKRLSEDIQGFGQHAKPAVTAAMKEVLGKAGFRGSLEGFDPDQVFLTHDGIRMSLTHWATSGWQRFGLRRTLLSDEQLPPVMELPGAGPVVDFSRDGAPWPSASDLQGITLVAYLPGHDGPAQPDAAQSQALNGEAARRAICRVLANAADSNDLASAYTAHLNAMLVPGNPTGRRFLAALSSQIRTRTAWMIEKAYTDGEINAGTYAALVGQHALLDPVHSPVPLLQGAGHGMEMGAGWGVPAQTRPSSLKSVTLAGHPIDGLWAMQVGDTHYVFLPETDSGDLLLRADAFKTWVEQDNNGREDYIRLRTLYRYHPALGLAFSTKEAFGSIPVGFATTDGPDDAARVLIEGRISDVDEKTVSRLEQLAESLKVIGTLVVGAVCMAASAGAGAALCVTGSLALLADDIRRGLNDLERGDRHGAIEKIVGSLAGAVDMLGVAQLPALLSRLGRRTLTSAEDAASALVQWRAQYAPRGKPFSMIQKLPDGRIGVLAGPTDPPTWSALEQQQARLHALRGKDAALRTASEQTELAQLEVDVPALRTALVERHATVIETNRAKWQPFIDTIPDLRKLSEADRAHYLAFVLSHKREVEVTSLLRSLGALGADSVSVGFRNLHAAAMRQIAPMPVPALPALPAGRAGPSLPGPSPVQPSPGRSAPVQGSVQSPGAPRQPSGSPIKPPQASPGVKRTSSDSLDSPFKRLSTGGGSRPQPSPGQGLAGRGQSLPAQSSAARQLIFAPPASSGAARGVLPPNTPEFPYVEIPRTEWQNLRLWHYTTEDNYNAMRAQRFAVLEPSNVNLKGQAGAGPVPQFVYVTTMDPAEGREAVTKALFGKSRWTEQSIRTKRVITLDPTHFPEGTRMAHITLPGYEKVYIVSTPDQGYITLTHGNKDRSVRVPPKRDEDSIVPD